MQNHDTDAPGVTSKLSNFFAVCGGTTLSTFKKINPDDQQKRITAGIVVVAIATVSAILASVAWSIPMGWPGYSVGPLWFVIMLLLERSILQQMDVVAVNKLAKNWLDSRFETEARSGVGLGWLLVRFTMIVFICYFNSEMIRVIMFKPEIVAEIKLRQDKQTANISDSLNKVRSTIKTKFEKAGVSVVNADKDLTELIQKYNDQIKDLDDSLNHWRSKVIFEVKGPGGVTGNPGDGPVAKTIRQSINQFDTARTQLIAQRDSAKTGSVQANSLRLAQADLDTARAQMNRDIDAANKKELELKKQIMDRPVNGLSFMLAVLNDISGRNIIIWAVFFLFFFIEAIPVLLKFFAKNDSFIYERALDHLRMIQSSNEKARTIVQALEAMKR